MIVRVEFKAGAIGALHQHPAGRRRRRTVRASPWVTKHPDSSPAIAFTRRGHRARRALEDGALIDVFTPVRKDFLMPGL
jgi:hypothetical protein